MSKNLNSPQALTDHRNMARVINLAKDQGVVTYTRPGKGDHKICKLRTGEAMAVPERNIGLGLAKKIYNLLIAAGIEFVILFFLLLQPYLKA